MDRVTQAFARQFESDDQGLTFRDSYSKKVYRVTAEERDQIVEKYQRLTGRNTLVMMSPLGILVVFAIFINKFPDRYVGSAISLIFAAVLPLCIWGAWANFRARAQSLKILAGRHSISSG